MCNKVIKKGWKCKKKFRLHEQLRKHQKAHDTDFICEWDEACQKSYSSRSALLHHQFVVHGFTPNYGYRRTLTGHRCVFPNEFQRRKAYKTNEFLYDIYEMDFVHFHPEGMELAIQEPVAEEPVTVEAEKTDG